MAHFAKLDENNMVLEVHVVNNAVLDPDNEETSGIAFLVDWSGGYPYWKQTSYTRKFRYNYAGIGFTYDEALDAFIPPICHEGAELDISTCTWICTDEEHNAPIMVE